MFYTVVASFFKFFLGLYLALLLNRRLPFKSLLRAIVLLPFVVPTVLSAIAFWWIYDPQFSIVSWALIKFGLIGHYIDFLGEPWHARWSVIAANVWRGIPFVTITLLAGLQTISPSLHEAATLDGASAWQRFRFVTLPLLSPIIAVVMTFSVLMTFTDFQLIYTITRGRPDQRHAIDGDAVVRAGDHRRPSRRGRGDRQRDGARSCSPPSCSAISACSGAAGSRDRGADDGQSGRARRHGLSRARCRAALVTLYLPLAVFVFVLLFPFYWMTTTTFKPDEELYDYARFNPFWIVHPTLAHIHKLFFETSYPQWLYQHHVRRGGLDDPLAVLQRLRGLCDRTAAVQRRALCRARDLPRLSGAARASCSSRSPRSSSNSASIDSDWALVLTYPTFLVPFCTWLLMGYFRTIPYELEECAMIDGASRLQVLWTITLPLAVPGLISAGIFAFTLSWNEFIYALTFISSSENKTVPVGAITELVEGDVYHWGSLMAAALLGSLPVVILYSFFVEYYVSSLTGAVKE